MDDFVLSSKVEGGSKAACSSRQKGNNGSRRKQKLTFCVKYSDFCKCTRCETYREAMADINPKTIRSSEGEKSKLTEA